MTVSVMSLIVYYFGKCLLFKMGMLSLYISDLSCNKRNVYMSVDWYEQFQFSDNIPL